MSQETLTRAWEVLQDAYQAQMEGDYDRAAELYRRACAAGSIDAILTTLLSPH